MRTAVCPGTFDPITFGHLDIIERALHLFDEVVVGVAQNPGKLPLFTTEERLETCRLAVQGLDRVRVELVPGLLAHWCAEQRITAIVKGIRSGTDLELEEPMVTMNRFLGGVETVFLAADGKLRHISSTLVKDIAQHGGSIDTFTPIEIAEAVRAALTRRGLGKVER
jgi:pantetheine-phosphate adenylyltransferase